MKKAYMKPGMYIESFSLAQSIAAGCGVQHDSTLGGPLQWSKTTCAWQIGGAAFWQKGVIDGCSFDGGEQTESNGEIICYNTPNGTNTIFGS